MTAQRWKTGLALAVGVLMGAGGAALVVLDFGARRDGPTGDYGRALPEADRPRFGPDESDVISNTHVGRTRAAVVAELGPPSAEWPGHFGRASAPQGRPNARTLLYRWPSGAFYASVDKVNGRWECVRSAWVPKNMVID